MDSTLFYMLYKSLISCYEPCLPPIIPLVHNMTSMALHAPVLASMKIAPLSTPLYIPDWKNNSLKIHQEGIMALYWNKPFKIVVVEVQQVVDNVNLTGSRYMFIHAACVLGSRDITLYTIKAADTEYLVELCDLQLPWLPHSARAYMIPEMFSILVHGVPKALFLQKSILSSKACMAIMQENAPCIPQAQVLYIVWIGGYHTLQAQKLKGSLVISFYQAKDVNTFLYSGLILDSTLYRTELYDP